MNPRAMSPRSLLPRSRDGPDGSHGESPASVVVGHVDLGAAMVCFPRVCRLLE
jgi:hypothetical protein